MGEPIGGQHGATHTKFGYGSPQLDNRGGGILQRNDRHRIEPRITLEVIGRDPVVVRSADSSGIVAAHDFPVRKRGSRVDDGRNDSRVIEELLPILRTGIPLASVAIGRRLHGVCRVDVVERWEERAAHSVAVRLLQMSADRCLVFDQMAVTVDNASRNLNRHVVPLTLAYFETSTQMLPAAPEEPSITSNDASASTCTGCRAPPRRWALTGTAFQSS